MGSLDSNGVYRFIFEGSLEAILLTDREGSILAANSAVEELFGYSESELCELNISGIVDMGDSRLNPFLEQRREKGKVRGELSFIKKNGEKFPGKVSSYVFQDENGSKIIIMAIIDITLSKIVETALKQSEKRYRKLFENMQEGFAYCKMLFDEDGKPYDWIFLDVNTAFRQITGLKNVKGKLVTEIIPEIKEMEPELFKTFGNVACNGLPEHFELFFKPFKIWLDMSVYMPEIEHFVIVFENITERKKTEKELKISEKKYRQIFENVQDIFFQTDLEGNITEISPSIERYSGYKPEELIGQPVERVYLNPEDRKLLLKNIGEKGEVVDYELRLKAKDNNLIYVSTNAHVMRDSQNKPVGMEGSLRDITERKNIEIQLQKSLQEKEMLLKEIHHRVKNNLMIISSLLNAQSRYIKDKESQEIFKESQDRARSMAIIHERLYRSVDLKRIDFADYIRTLSKELFHVYTDHSGRINLNINLEPLFLDINMAIPLGLIINELITNCLKHAFIDGRNGNITIESRKNGEYYELMVKDDGVGFPLDIDYRNTTSLGLQLVNSLTKQIDGVVEMDSIEGTCFKIIFKDK